MAKTSILGINHYLLYAKNKACSSRSTFLAETTAGNVWEPEIIISGIVLFGLLQIPPGLDAMLRYLNDWGTAILFLGNLDEFLVAFLKTSVYILIVGLIVNLLLRSVWVVMIGLSYTIPGGADLSKLRLQSYYARKLQNIPSYAAYIIRLDKMASMIYALTFLLFMCLIGFCTAFLVFSGVFLAILSFPYFRQFVYEGSWINEVFSGVLLVFGGVYLLDFVTLGWLKRFDLYARLFRPVYAIMSVLTLAPIYRIIYYGLISRFNRWKIGVCMLLYVVVVFILTREQLGGNSLLNASVLYKNTLNVATYDGYYRDKAPEKISQWLHVPSAQVQGPVLELFIAHKAALEDSVMALYSRNHHLSRADIIRSDSVVLKALSEFYRFKLDGQWVEPVPLTFMNFSKYNQQGLLGFIEIASLNRGTYHLELWLQGSKPRQVANLVFYKTGQAEPS